MVELLRKTRLFILIEFGEAEWQVTSDCLKTHKDYNGIRTGDGEYFHLFNSQRLLFSF
jgi:hypothetical protein